MQSEVKKRRMIHLKVEPNSKYQGSLFESIKMFNTKTLQSTNIEEMVTNDEPEILYNFESDDEVHDNPLKPSRPQSPASSTYSNKSDKDIFKLKDDLQEIANEPSTCMATMNTIMGALHNYFPWLPENADTLKNKTYSKVAEPPSISNMTVHQSRIKFEQQPTSSNFKDQNIQYVMMERTEIDEIKKNIETIKNGQQTILKEFKSFRKFRVSKIDRKNAKFKLPFDDLDKFMKFDNELLIDNEMKDQLTRIYMTEVEFDPQKYIKNNLRKLFSVQLGMKFSYRGRQGNLCAEKINTIQILRDCVEELYPQCHKDMFERCATNHFYYIKDKITKAQKNPKRTLPEFSCANTIEFVLPFNEIEPFKSFDASLHKDPELTLQLKVMYLEETQIEYRRFLFNNFKKMFTNELGNQFCIYKKEGELCIREFNIIKIMKDCALEKYTSITEQNFYNCANQYLSHVKQKVYQTQRGL